MPIVLEPPIIGRASGLTNAIVPGTGTAVPTGLEAIIEYDGVVFNNTDVIDKYRITEIAGFDDADIRDAREANPGYHGETAFDAWYSGRTISLTGRIEAYTLEKLRDMQIALREVFSELVEKPLIIRSYDGTRDVIINCRKSAPIVMREAQGDFRFFRDFQVTLRASNPRWLSYYRQTITKTLTFTDDFSTNTLSNYNFE